MKKLILLLPAVILLSLSSCKKDNFLNKKPQLSEAEKLSRPKPDKKDDCKCDLKIEVTQLPNYSPYAHVYVTWKKDKKVLVNIKTDQRDANNQLININVPGNTGFYDDTVKFANFVKVTVMNKSDTCRQETFNFRTPVVD
jgi:hypothetical protein